jgi:hypothetical protein
MTEPDASLGRDLGAALVAFIAEHEHCGELASVVDDERVTTTCTCGASIRWCSRDDAGLRANWNTWLPQIRPHVTPDAGVTPDMTPYTGNTFKKVTPPAA